MENKTLEKARRYAFLLLKYRLRSTKELGERLARKKFPADIAGQVIKSLEEKGFLDDNAFARAWIASRGQKFGGRRITQELRQKGIAPDLVTEGLRELKERCPEEETIRRLAGAKLRKSTGLHPQTAKRRIYAYLLRRGFSPDAVIDTLNEMI